MTRHILKIELTTIDKELAQYYSERKNYGSDAGVNICFPTTLVATKSDFIMVSLGIRANISCGKYNIMPRSSIYKYPIRMQQIMTVTNNGNELVVKFKVLNDCKFDKLQSILQIVAPDLNPIDIELVENNQISKSFREHHYILKLMIISNDPELQKYYQTLESSSRIPLCFPKNVSLKQTTNSGVLVGLGVICKMICRDNEPRAYYLDFDGHKNVGLANTRGLIDSSYRGEICAALDVYNDCEFNKLDSIVSICTNDTTPIRIDIVNELDATERGTGGFGSTGK